MSDRQCVFAWTAPSNGVAYPEYLNVSTVDGKIVFIMRGRPEGGHPGPTATLELPRDQMMELRSRAFDALLLTQT